MKQMMLAMIAIGSIILIAWVVCKKSSGKRTRSARATQAGLYQSDASFIPWDNLRIDVETDYADKVRKTEPKRPYTVFSENGYNGDLILTDNITGIGEYAFGDCASLTSINCPDTLTSIAEAAFYGCTALKSIYLPNNITRIGDWAFGKCKSLANINYAGTKKEWDAIDKGLEWYEDSGLETITCSDGVISL